MKKLIAMLLALTMMVALAACGTQTEKEPAVQTVEALTALQTVVTAYNTQYEGTDYQLPIVGGGYEAMNWEGPDVVPTTDVDYLTAQLIVPEEQIANIGAAASAMHAMNTNIFCAGAYNLVEGADYNAFAAALEAAIMGNRWMCGFPEKLLIVNVGNCLIVVYGNGEVVANFNTVVGETYSAATIICDKAVGE